MVRTDAVTKAVVISEYGFAEPSATIAALFVKPVSRTYSSEPASVWPGATRSRMVARRIPGSATMSRRSVAAKPPADVVVIAARGTETRREPRKDELTPSMCSLVTTNSPADFGDSLRCVSRLALTSFCSASSTRACSSPCFISNSSTLADVSLLRPSWRSTFFCACSACALS